MNRGRIALPATVAAGLIAIAAIPAVAHDFWLVPNAFRVALGRAIEVRGQTSSRFPTSESAVAVDRVADARIISSTREERIDSLSVRGMSLVLRHRPSRSGQYAVFLSIHPRSLRESVAGFRRYLELEGAPDALARLDASGQLAGRDSLTRRYAKYAKTFVQVGRGGPRVFDKRSGHPLEFVPLSDPGVMRAGDSLRVALLYHGRPLAGARLSAGGVRDTPGHGEAIPASLGPDTVVVTDPTGTAVLRPRFAGIWNVRTIHIAEAPAGSLADWDAHWATIVFPVSRR